MRRRILALLGALAIAVSVLVGFGAGTASAINTCSYWRSGQTAYATCEFGPGYVGAWASCPDGSGGWILYTGPLVTAGHTSAVVCRYAPPRDWGYWTEY